MEERDSFTYMGSNNSKIRGTQEDIIARIKKSVSFLTLSNICKAKQIKLDTCLRIFDSTEMSGQCVPIHDYVYSVRFVAHLSSSFR